MEGEINEGDKSRLLGCVQVEGKSCKVEVIAASALLSTLFLPSFLELQRKKIKIFSVSLSVGRLAGG